MHKPYQEIFGHPADFRVAYRFYTVEEGGRYITPAQGYRSNFVYAEKWPDANGAFMIFPEFEDEQENVFIEKEDIYVSPIGTARMWILDANLRKLHQQRIKVGTKGYFVEGIRNVAECEVTQILGLMSNPTEEKKR